MKPSRLSHWLRVSLLLALCSLTAYACGGPQFTATGGSGAVDGGISGDTSSGGSSLGGSRLGGSSAGSSDTPPQACQGPEDCDDGDPCTVDQCGADGTCKRAPKCDATQKCCGGTCGECCDKGDCNDHFGCTDDDCFAGACTHAPNDANCGTDEYCAVASGCRHKQACTDSTASTDCDDQDPCTTDSCVNSLCEHPPTVCGVDAPICCAGVGCAECCEDSQCNDNDPCTTDKCVSGQCSNDPLCHGPTAGASCCPNAAGTSATCGTCCSAANCDDKIDCTKNSCNQGTCSFTPDDTACQTGFSCDPVAGKCVQTAQCLRDSDCTSSNKCATGKCVSGSCTFPTCVNGGHCCGADLGCSACCNDATCDDSIACTTDKCSSGTCSNTPNNANCGAGLTCDPANGGCIQCTKDKDCDDNSACTTDSCDLKSHRCVNLPTCDPKTSFCCGGTCGACCFDSDCQGGGGVTTQAIIKACPTPICDVSSFTCTTKLVSCPLGQCCATGCCGVVTL